MPATQVIVGLRRQKLNFHAPADNFLHRLAAPGASVACWRRFPPIGGESSMAVLPS
jgi:hypothetical protein